MEVNKYNIIVVIMQLFDTVEKQEQQIAALEAKLVELDPTYKTTDSE